MKNVLITGANKGIGFQTARQLAELGFFVYIGSRENQKVLQAEEQLKDAGLTNVASIELDVTNPESIKKAKARFSFAFKKQFRVTPSALINNNDN